MRVAALYDVHANLPALEAVLAEVEREQLYHVQFDVEYAHHRIVNPGSVGNPTVRATAWWALLGDDVDLRTTDYDTAGTAAAMRATGFPGPQLADELLEPYALERVLELVESFA